MTTHTLQPRFSQEPLETEQALTNSNSLSGTKLTLGSKLMAVLGQQISHLVSQQGALFNQTMTMK